MNVVQVVDLTSLVHTGLLNLTQGSTHDDPASSQRQRPAVELLNKTAACRTGRVGCALHITPMRRISPGAVCWWWGFGIICDLQRFNQHLLKNPHRAAAEAAAELDWRVVLGWWRV